MGAHDFQQQFNQELEQRTFLALERARDLGLPPDDLSLLCWHSGIDSRLIIERSEHGNRS